MRTELFDIVSRIPYGKVTSYGVVAQRLDMYCDIKTSWYIVWRLLSTMTEAERMHWWCPWWRVINKQWYISTLKLGRKGLIQKQLLEKEKIEIINDTVDMKKYWITKL